MKGEYCVHERKIQRKGEFTHKLNKNRLAKLDLEIILGSWV